MGKSTATFDGGFWVSTMWNTGIVWAQRMVVNGSVVHTWDSFTDAPVDSCTAEPVIPTPAPVVPAVLTPAPVVSNDPRCPWLNESSGEHDVIVCGDGTRCNAETAADGWSCCNNHGGRALCPSNYPNFCKMMNLCGSAKDYCCGDEDTCAGMNGLRECKGAGNEHFPAPAPASTPAPVVVPTPAPVVSNVTCEDIKDKKQCKQSPNCIFNQKKCWTAKACSEIKNKRECKSRKNKKRCKVKKTKTEVNGDKVKTNTCVDKVVE